MIGPCIRIQSLRNQAFYLPCFQPSSSRTKLLRVRFPPCLLTQKTILCNFIAAHTPVLITRQGHSANSPSYREDFYTSFFTLFFAISRLFLRCILEDVCLSSSPTLTAMKPSFYCVISVATFFPFLSADIYAVSPLQHSSETSYVRFYTQTRINMSSLYTPRLSVLGVHGHAYKTGWLALSAPVLPVLLHVPQHTCWVTYSQEHAPQMSPVGLQPVSQLLCN